MDAVGCKDEEATETYRDNDKQIYRQTDYHTTTGKENWRPTEIQTDRQTERPTAECTINTGDRKTEGQTDRQTIIRNQTDKKNKNKRKKKRDEK